MYFFLRLFYASGTLFMYLLCIFQCQWCFGHVYIMCFFFAQAVQCQWCFVNVYIMLFFSGCSMPIVLCSCINYVGFFQAVQCQWCFVHVYIMCFFLRLFNASGAEVKSSSFPPGGSYQPSQGDGSLDIMGNRITTLGTNM